MADVDVRKLITERPLTHGDFTDTSAVIQATKRLWHGNPGWEKLSDVQRECFDMIAHKIGRALCGDPNHADHYADIAGYATLVADRVAKDK